MIKPFVKYFGFNLYLAKNILKFPLPKHNRSVFFIMTIYSSQIYI